MKKADLRKRIIAIVMSTFMVIGLLPFSTAVAAPTSVMVEAIYDAFYGTVTGGGSYNEGDMVTLTATPAEDMKFMYWLDATVQFDEMPAEEALRAAIASYDAEYTFTATTDMTLEAVFFAENKIPIVPLLTTGIDEESLMEAEWINMEGDYDTITLGAEQISLPGDLVEEIITIGDKQYEFAGFVFFGYDEATDTETLEVKETFVIQEMPLYGSEEYWNWFIPISDGVYVAYMEYTPDGAGEELETPSSPPTGDNGHMALWVALLFISGGALTVTAVERKRRTAES